MQPSVTEQKLKDLYNAVFEDEEDFCDRFFEKFYSPQNAVCIFEGQELVSAVHIIDTVLTDGKDEYDSGYIFAAATLPEHRSKGCMSRLLRRSIERAKHQKKEFLFLILGEESLENYYSRFGFVRASKNEETELAPGTSAASVCPVERAKEEFDLSDGVHILRTRKHLEDLLYVYGAELFENQKGICAAYRAGDTAVIPKLFGDKSVCSDVCNSLNTKSAVVTLSASVMILPLSERAKKQKNFNIDFMLN